VGLLVVGLGDHAADTAGPEVSADRARGVGLVGQHPVGPGPWPADRALDTQVREQRQHHRRVTGLVGGEQDGQRAAPSVDRGVDLRAEPAPRAADTQKSAKSTTFTDEERVAMKERAQEQKATARRGPRAAKADGESAVLAKIAEMPGPDRAMGERLHAVIKASAPALSPRLWYGMPAYAKDGKVVCFFQNAQKFKTRYATLGFSDDANLDEGAMWPTAFALTELTAADEARIGALVKKAVS
jgi:hypothetical protein